MMNGKISIIVPVYNTEAYLHKCVDSLLCQTYENLQIILVNDGSKDYSPKICDEYARQDERVTVVHKTNGGLSSARNAGLAVAQGRYIGFVDSDDHVSSEMYERLYKAITASDCDIANVMYERIDENGVTSPSAVPHKEDKIIEAQDFVRELMMHTGDVSVCTKLFKKELFESVKFGEGKLNEDLLFMLEAFSHIKRVAFVGYVGYYYFIRSGSISSGYGKAVIDMVGNSLVAKGFVSKAFPSLKREASRFALYQHMAYLLLVPKEQANKTNLVYKGAIKYVRRNIWKNLFNKCLRSKDRLILILLAIMPKTMAHKYQVKRNLK